MISSLRLGCSLISSSSLRIGLVSLLALGFASGCGRNAQVIGDEMSGVSTAGDSDGSGGGTVDNGGASAVTGSGPTTGSGGATLAEGGVGNDPAGGSASGGFSAGGDDAQGNGGAEPGGGASQGGATLAEGGASQGGFQNGGAASGGVSQGGFESGGASSGGATNSDCACGEDQFCSRESCELDAAGACSDIPEGCLTDVQPVCGCDGKTYSNGCERLRAGVSLDHAGECECAVTGVQCRTTLDGEVTFEQPCCSGQVCTIGGAASGSDAVVYYCEADPCGGCDDGERCIYQLGGPGPSHYACAPQLPCGSNEECACITGQGTCDVSATEPTLCECENGLE